MLRWTKDHFSQATEHLEREPRARGAVARVANNLGALWGEEVTSKAIAGAFARRCLPSPEQFVGKRARVPTDRAYTTPSKPHRRILVIPDVHAPYEDKRAFSVAIEAAKLLAPDVIVIIGDFVDCYSISTFPKSQARQANLRDEIDAANVQLDRLAGLSDSVYFLEGNHEVRLARYIEQRAPDLYGLLTIPELLKIHERGWKWFPYRQHVKLGHCSFVHEVGHFGKYATQLSLDSFGGNIVFGHTHRGASVYQGTIDGGHRFALNVGWLGDATQADYMHRAQTRSWQHGIGLVEQNDHGNSWGSFVPIVDYKMIVCGREVSV